MIDVLSHIICHEFEIRCGKHQLVSDVSKADPQAFKLTFDTEVKYDKEEGYRYLDVIIYGPMNYVQVWMRRRWDVIPVEDMDYNEDGGTPLPGKDYQKGASEWVLLGDHDSGWREGVRKVLSEKDITTLRTFNGGDWWKLIPAKEVPEKG